MLTCLYTVFFYYGYKFTANFFPYKEKLYI